MKYSIKTIRQTAVNFYNTLDKIHKSKAGKFMYLTIN